MSQPTEWDRRYAATARLFPIEPDTALVEFAAPLVPGRAVDLGAGEGRNSLWLARHGWEVVAVDTSSVALDRLRTSASEEGLNVSTVQADISDFLGRGERFDLAVLAYIHPAVSERAALLAAAARAVAPAGHLFLIGHHLDSLGQAGPPDPERLYTEARLSDAFPRLDVIRMERREHRRGAHVEQHERPANSQGELLVDIVVWASAAEKPTAAPTP